MHSAPPKHPRQRYRQALALPHRWIALRFPSHRREFSSNPVATNPMGGVNDEERTKLRRRLAGKPWPTTGPPMRTRGCTTKAPRRGVRYRHMDGWWNSPGGGVCSKGSQQSRRSNSSKRALPQYDEIASLKLNEKKNSPLKRLRLLSLPPLNTSTIPCPSTLSLSVVRNSPILCNKHFDSAKTPYL